jgi:hypothetical protein
MYLQRLVLSAQSQDENNPEDGYENFLADRELEFRDPLLEVGAGASGTLTSGWRREMKEVRICIDSTVPVNYDFCRFYFPLCRYLRITTSSSRKLQE